MEINLTPNSIRIIITVFNFGILCVILNHFLFKPVNDMLTSRQKEIDSSIRKTKEDEVNAEKNRIESENYLKGSRNQGKEIVEEYKDKAHQLYDEMLKEAHMEAQTIRDRGVRDAQREKEKAEAEIRKDVVDLALMLSSKALEETIDEEQHRRLIENFIAKVGI